jgi:hypothetical protein
MLVRKLENFSDLTEKPFVIGKGNSVLLAQANRARIRWGDKISLFLPAHAGDGLTILS